MRFQGILYRAHDPKWAFSPTSGDGAKAKGGRFNPKGMSALYLAHSVVGMFAEMGHGFANRFSPLTVCSYEVDVEDIIDLRTDADRNVAKINLSDLACAWLFETHAGREPKSWTIAKKYIADGKAGLLVPSFAATAQPDAYNLVLWNWSDSLPRSVRVIDPGAQLPTNQDSWPTAPKAK